YRLAIFELTGWDLARDCEIAEDDPIPERPWLAFWMISIEGEGRGRIISKAFPILFVTHHVLSRAAQRRGVRTVPDLIEASLLIWGAGHRRLGAILIKDGLIEPPGGWREPLEGGGTVVLKRHEERQALVAVTLF